MQLNISHHGDVTVIDIEEQPKSEDLDTLVKRVTNFCKGGRKKFILNLRGLDRLSSTDIAALVNINDTCKEHDSKLVLCQLQSKINYVLEITNLRPFFQIAESFSAAVSLLGGAGVAQAAVDRANPVAAREAERRAQAMAEKFISRAVKTRLHLRVLQILESARLEIISPTSLSEATGEEEERILPIIADLVKLGVLSEVGTRTYNYSPSQERSREIRQFLDMWNSPRYHSQILSRLLEREGKKS
ncbi:MAG: STAS domain-containing protein [Planctomycetota bacterium]